MTYELLRNKLTNGTPYLKKDAQRWIDALPLAVTPDQARELQGIADQYGLDFLPEDGEGRLTQVEQRAEATDAQATYTAMMTDTLMEV